MPKERIIRRLLLQWRRTSMIVVLTVTYILVINVVMYYLVYNPSVNHFFPEDDLKRVCDNESGGDVSSIRDYDEQCDEYHQIKNRGVEFGALGGRGTGVSKVTVFPNQMTSAGEKDFANRKNSQKETQDYESVSERDSAFPSLKIPRLIIEEEDFCRRRPGLQIIAYVHSSIKRVKEREDTRATWANTTITSSHLGVNIAAVFMVGRPKNEAERQILLQETQRYHDIVQGDYGEDYRLLSYKGLAAISWVTRNCPQVRWTVHADDDVFIDVYLLHDYLNSLGAETFDKFVCSTMYAKVMRKGRWSVSSKDFPDHEYPTFCSGAAWALPTRLLPRLLKASQETRFLWVDDVYITGVLAKQANISHLGEGFGSKHINGNEIGLILVWYHLKDDRRQLWNKFVKIYDKTLQKQELTYATR